MSDEPSFRTARRRPEPAGELPPHNIEAEQGVLGCVLLAYKECMPKVAEALPDARAFYDLRHQTIYAALQALFIAGQAIDLLTVNAWLATAGKREDAGGLEYLASVPEAVPSAANLDEYLTIVRDLWTKRQLIAGLALGVQTLTGPTTETAPEQVERIAANIAALSAKADVTRLHRLPPLLREAVETIEKTVQHRTHAGLAAVALGAMQTGIGYLDIVTTGLYPKELTLLAARPSMGKTSLATTMMLEQAVRHGRKVGFISIETAASGIAYRMLCSEAEVSMKKVRSGFASEAMVTAMTQALVRLNKADLTIVDRSRITPAGMRALAYRLKAERGIEILYIDHLNEVKNPDNNGAGHESANVEEAVEAARSISRDLEIPVVALMQLNRELTKSRKNPRPGLADLRGHGSAEQAADLIWLLWRDADREELEAESGWNGHDDEGNETERLIQLIVAKQRNGPTGDVLLRYRVQPMRFKDWTKHGTQTNWKKAEKLEQAEAPL